MNPKEALEKFFGYKEFRPSQQEIIDKIVNNGNVLAVLPTGAGKSLCYQIPALISDNFSIVISPLIALMKDQVDALNQSNNSAAFINSSMSFLEAEQVLQDIAFGKVKILYVAPERLEALVFAEKIKKLSPNYLFVDEAHCISEWGHNFRPSYLKIKEFVDFVEIKKISAFTATATPEVVQDIVKQLDLKDPKIFVRGFERPNLFLNSIITNKKSEKCVDLISAYKTPSIIYTSSRKKAEEASEYLNLHRIKSEYYHAGMKPEERKKVQENFINDVTPVICATNAFGMGIDKKDIRLIIHFNTPGSIENYYQEIGRAGRDGNDSFAFLLYDESDIKIQQFFLSNSHPNKEFIQNIYSAVCDYGKIALGNSSDKPIPLNMDYISSFTKRKISKGLLHSSLKLLENAGYLRILSEYETQDSIQFNYDKNSLKEFVKNSINNTLKDFIVLLLREFGNELFINKTNISISRMVEKHELTSGEIIESLIILDNLGILNYNKTLSKENVLLTSPRILPERLNIDYKKINENYLHLQKKIDKMVNYVFTNECRFKYILNYFGEETENYSCGKCDRCRDTNLLPDSTIDYINEIFLRTINQAGSLAEKDIINTLLGKARSSELKALSTYSSCSNYSKNDLLTILEKLLNEKKLKRKVENNRIIEITKNGIDVLFEENIFEQPVRQEINYEKDLELFNLLREIRKKASEKFLQTAYLICPDEILRDIAEKKPKTSEELLSIPGFNRRMFNKIGEDILEIVVSYKNDKEDSDDKSENSKNNSIPKNITETYNLLKKGYELKDIASLRNLTEAVISMQIETIIEFNPEVDISNLIDKNKINLIFDEIKKGYDNLKDLKERLPNNITYSIIRIAAAKYKFSSS